MGLHAPKPHRPALAGAFETGLSAPASGLAGDITPEQVWRLGTRGDRSKGLPGLRCHLSFSPPDRTSSWPSSAAPRHPWGAELCPQASAPRARLLPSPNSEALRTPSAQVQRPTLQMGRLRPCQGPLLPLPSSRGRGEGPCRRELPDGYNPASAGAQAPARPPARLGPAPASPHIARGGSPPGSSLLWAGALSPHPAPPHPTTARLPPSRHSPTSQAVPEARPVPSPLPPESQRAVLGAGWGPRRVTWVHFLDMLEAGETPVFAVVSVGRVDEAGELAARARRGIPGRAPG